MFLTVRFTLKYTLYAGLYGKTTELLLVGA
jgi:hypothetical protein